MPIILESGNKYGCMNMGALRPENMTDQDKKLLQRIHSLNAAGIEEYLKNGLSREDKELVFATHRKQWAKDSGFNWKTMYMADQDSFNPKKQDLNLPHGTYQEISRMYVEAYPNGMPDIPEDILVIEKDVPGVVIGHPVADCPVVMLTDKKKGVSAIAHCGAAMIDAQLPRMLAEVLLSNYGSKAENIYAYVSACAGDGWTYTCFPKWAKDMKIWEHLIYQGTDGLFHINIRPAVLEQLLKTGIERSKIIVNQDDTIKSSAYYSNSAASPYGGNDPTREGRHFAGIFYTDNDDGKITIRGPHK